MLRGKPAPFLAGRRAGLDGRSMVLPPGTAQHKAAGARRAGAGSSGANAGEASGPSPGGYGTEACVIADGSGRAVASARPSS
jgi:hypothetical protein